MSSYKSYAKKLNVIFDLKLLYVMDEAAKSRRISRSDYIRLAVQYMIKRDRDRDRIEKLAYQEFVETTLALAKTRYSK